ncbi:uncharacterized protein LOC110725527 [Chenopodium quinoa]|uniref:uncharacterized protein LOC110725527 n=1 Tax=Chenopodium quinoa TaxID=63459 RepID=UPI000B78110A|nr:uncharacterized protein LOC110725527 [Chenopodium quinoa]
MLDEEFYAELVGILKRDDKDSFVELLDENPEHVESCLMILCAKHKSKKCLTALVTGEVCEPPPPPEGCATCIHGVAYVYPDPDVINIMLMRGAIRDCNIKCKVGFPSNYGTPLFLALDSLSHPAVSHLDSWCLGDSIIKLIVLLCMWETKQRLDSARLLACHTESVNDIAWTLLQDGKLKQLAALLLVARDEAMAPTETGMTIQQHLTNEIDGLSSEVDFDNSMLMDARVLFDVFDRAGEALSSYCITMFKPIPPEKVLVDVVGLLKEAGFPLQSRDVDLRDCYRGRRGVWRANLFKLSDTLRPDNIIMESSSSSSHLHTFAGQNGKLVYSQLHWDPLLGRLKSREVLKFSSSVPEARSLSTVAGSSIPLRRHLAYVAFKLKRGIRYL